MEGLGILLDLVWAFVDEGLQALKLEVSDLFGGSDGKLVDESGDQVGAVVGVPAVAELFVIFILVETDPLGMLLDKPQQYASGPLL